MNVLSRLRSLEYASRLDELPEHLLHHVVSHCDMRTGRNLLVADGRTHVDDTARLAATLRHTGVWTRAVERVRCLHPQLQAPQRQAAQAMLRQTAVQLMQAELRWYRRSGILGPVRLSRLIRGRGGQNIYSITAGLGLDVSMVIALQFPWALRAAGQIGEWVVVPMMETSAEALGSLQATRHLYNEVEPFMTPLERHNMWGHGVLMATLTLCMAGLFCLPLADDVVRLRQIGRSWLGASTVWAGLLGATGSTISFYFLMTHPLRQWVQRSSRRAVGDGLYHAYVAGFAQRLDAFDTMMGAERTHRPHPT